MQQVETPYTLAKIRDLNDGFRKTMVGGMVIMSSAVYALDQQAKHQILLAIQRYNDFEKDIYAEHSYGSFRLFGRTYLWQIDYRDRSMEMASPDPTDNFLTRRILTIRENVEW